MHAGDDHSRDQGAKFRKTVSHVMSMAPQSASRLEMARRAFKPLVPPLLLGAVKKTEGAATTSVANEDAIKARFPNLYGQPIVDLAPAPAADGSKSARPPLKVGCVLSGGQAAGGHVSLP